MHYILSRCSAMDLNIFLQAVGHFTCVAGGRGDGIFLVYKVAVDEYPLIISYKYHDLPLRVFAAAYGPARYLEYLRRIRVLVQHQLLRPQENLYQLPVLMGKEWGSNAAELQCAVILVKGADDNSDEQRNNEQLKEQVVAVCGEEHKAHHTDTYDQ